MKNKSVEAVAPDPAAGEIPPAIAADTVAAVQTKGGVDTTDAVLAAAWTRAATQRVEETKRQQLQAVAIARRTVVPAEVLTTDTETRESTTAADQMSAVAEIQAAMAALKIKMGTDCTPEATAAAKTAHSKVAATPMENQRWWLMSTRCRLHRQQPMRQNQQIWRTLGVPQGEVAWMQRLGQHLLAPFPIHLAKL